MKTLEPLTLGVTNLPFVKRKAIDISQQDLVRTSPLFPGRDLPALIQPGITGVNLIAWAASNRDFIQENLYKSGGILFRGFRIRTADEFEQLIKAVSGELIAYRERSSPRSQVSGNIYTSTDYPANQTIFLHNEQSYNLTFPRKILFFCATAARRGGETPIADCRKLYQRINPKIRERFMERKYMYMRNYGDGFGLSWQTVFQTSSKSEVEQYCSKAGIQVEWKDGNRLRTRQVRDAVASHPVTGEMVWFNHATFFHVSTLELVIREALLAEFSEEDLPNNTYYGDGTPIEASVLDELREAYLEEKVSFAWQTGDVLMLDNMLAAHGRAPFEGPRKVLVGMADPFSWKEIQSSGGDPHEAKND